MQTALRTLGSSGVISFLLILPFGIMEVVNRRNFSEEFPVALFLGLWLNLFVVSVILLPIVLGRQTGKHNIATPDPTPRNTLLTNPWAAALISILIFLSPGILPLLDSVGWLSLDRLFNGPNPEVAYFPGMILSLAFLLFPAAAGIVAGRPIVHTLRAGGSLFAHPINLIIVVIIAILLTAGVATLIVDQWPCFIGVPNCD